MGATPRRRERRARYGSAGILGLGRTVSEVQTILTWNFTSHLLIGNVSQVEYEPKLLLSLVGSRDRCPRVWLCAPIAAASTHLQFLARGARGIELSTLLGPKVNSFTPRFQIGRFGRCGYGTSAVALVPTLQTCWTFQIIKKMQIVEKPPYVAYCSHLTCSLRAQSSGPHISVETSGSYKFRPCTRAEFKTAPYSMEKICLQGPKFM